MIFSLKAQRAATQPVRGFLIAVFACLGLMRACVPTLAAEPMRGAAELILTDSRLENVRLIAADADGQWTFKRDGEADNKVFAAGKVIRFGNFVQPAGQHRVRLAAGGDLVGYSVEVANEKVHIESDLLGKASIPLALVASILFDAPTDPRALARLEERIAAASDPQGMLLFANGDQLPGRLAGLAADKLTLKALDRDVVVDRSRVSAVVLHSTKLATGRPPETGRADAKAIATWAGLQDGSRMLARTLIVDKDDATVELGAGTTLSLPISAIVALQPIGGDAVYLSDMRDAGYRHIPFLSLPWQYRRDRNVTGGPLIASKRLYLKGLGMHSAARITYNLDRDYRRFQSELAIDDSTENRGSVNCRVFIDDGSGNWQLTYESPVIRGGAKPEHVDVDITGAKRISLLVDFADRGDELDHVNWLDARLVK
jgi:hypothetical protein